MLMMVRSALLLALISLAACGRATPRVEVLGVADAHRRAPAPDREFAVVFLEVINPGKQSLDLAALRYRIDTEAWFQADGELRLSRVVGANAATIIEVPVEMSTIPSGTGAALPADGSVSYTLEGTLFARADGAKRSWDVKARGVLSAHAVADARRALRVRVRIAGSQ